MFGSFGFQELIIILIIVLVLFGSSRIPQLMGGFGEGLKNFKKGLRDIENDKESKSSKETAEKKEKISN